MIKNFLHKGLKKFYLTGNVAGIQPDLQKRVRLILSRLEAIRKPEDMDLPGFKFHKLTGDLKGHYSVNVNKNWRIIFRFDDTDAYDVDCVDYH